MKRSTIFIVFFCVLSVGLTASLRAHATAVTFTYNHSLWGYQPAETFIPNNYFYITCNVAPTGINGVNSHVNNDGFVIDAIPFDATSSNIYEIKIGDPALPNNPSGYRYVQPGNDNIEPYSGGGGVEADYYSCGSTIQVSNNLSDISQATISFYKPANGSTLQDFNYWELTANNAPSGSVSIVYDRGTGNLATDTFAYYDPDYNPGVFDVWKYQSLFFPPLLPPVAYNATATLYNHSGAPIATDHITFNIIAPGGETSSTLPNTTTNCQQASSSFLADPVGNIQYGICQALNFLFVPNTDEQRAINANFSALYTSVQHKPPFGYATSIFSAFNGLAEGTATSSIMTTSTYSSFSSVFDPLKSMLSIALYLLFAFWLFHFAKKIKL